MTKTATDGRRCVPPALGAGAALSAMTFASRLPVTLDFILPRRAGWALFVAGYETLSRPGPRLAFTAFVTALFLLSLARFVWLAAASAKGRKWSLREFLTRGFSLAVVVLLMRWSFSLWFEVAQRAWFPFGSMSAAEPFVNLLVCSALIWLAMSAALALLAQRPPSSGRAFIRPLSGVLAGILLFWSCGGAAVRRYDRLRADSSASRRLFVVLTEEEGRPSQAAYDLPTGDESAFPDTAGAVLDRLPLRRLEILRDRYEQRAKLMDPNGLRGALLEGVKYGDELARSLLLESLSAVPPSPEAFDALARLSDETVHRVGPIGASRIALAYAHLGDASRARSWADKAAAGPRGIPTGLLDLNGGGALKPGRIAGRLEGLKPMKIALYRKSDPAAPYLLDAAALVASSVPDSKGRFSFEGLTAGRYYVAFAFAPDASRGELRVSGHRGDLVLDARKPALELSPLTIKIR